MLLTSIDVLNLVLAICVSLLTVFLCWAIFYFISFARSIRRITKKAERGVNKVEQIIEMVRQQLSSNSVYLSLFSSLVQKAMNVVKEKKTKTSKKKKK